MRLWLLHVGEELSVDDQPRKFRYGYLADALAARGHDVLRWAPTFQHSRKRQRYSADTCVAINDRYSIQFVHTAGYRRNVGLARWKCYRALARRFSQLAQRHPRPDAIVSGIPSLEWCEAALAFGKRTVVPTIIDVRDLWPDVLLNAVPHRLRFLGRPALVALNRQANRICRNADALCSVSQSYLDWALRRADRTARATDRVFPLGYAPPQITDTEFSARRKRLEASGVDFTKTICCFAGQFENSYDVATILAAARRLNETDLGREIQFVLCGDGSKMPTARAAAAGLSNVVLTGWVDAKTVSVLVRLSQVGLAAYSRHALQSLPNKFFEYLAGGLAIVSSLRGEMDSILAEQQCGVTYQAGSAESLVEAVRAVAADEPTIETYRRNAADLFRRQYSNDKIYGEFCQYLEEFVAAGKARSPLLESAA